MRGNQILLNFEDRKFKIVAKQAQSLDLIWLYLKNIA